MPKPEPTAPVPRRTAGLVEHNVALATLHPDLVLTRYARTVDDNNGLRPLADPMKEAQRPTLKLLTTATRGLSGQLDYPKLLARHQVVVESCATGPAVSFAATLRGPLALHLSRATALENAGICLHRTYGFVYLPATGLKGLARAYALEHWLPRQPDKEAAWKQILQVFGYAPSPDFRDLAKRLRDRDDAVYPLNRDDERSGSIVFHDAWPATVPAIELDILNNHHSKYYSEAHTPGDWEDPIIVNFPTIRGGQFTFHVTALRHDTSRAVVELAGNLLRGGLSLLGAGAKTSSGFGRFDAFDSAGAPAVVSPHRRSLEVTLELISPAFLAGARQDASDCDLTAKTLRGQLRWWWRTMHAGYISETALRTLEAAVWGLASQGSCVDIALTQLIRKTPRPAAKAYLSYGMVEDGRWMLPPGATWSLRLVARRNATGYRGVLSADDVLDQARWALWLLTTHGGVGSKARKGFGSLEAVHPLTGNVRAALASAAEFRRKANLQSLPEPPCDCAASLFHANANQLVGSYDWAEAGSQDVLRALGEGYQRFATDNKNKHCPRKAGLGLPRKIHGPSATPLRHQTAATHQPPQFLTSTKTGNARAQDTRYASPVHFHVTRKGNVFGARVVAFPNAHLMPTTPPMTPEARFAAHVQFLQEFLGGIS